MPDDLDEFLEIVGTEKPEIKRVCCAWPGCKATVDASAWTTFSPQDGWCHAGGIPPDGHEGYLCPIHYEAFEAMA
jgi:hypothetical protein